MTRSPLHVVGLLDHSDHRATPRCPCRPEPMRDLAEPGTSVYVHPRPDAAKAGHSEAVMNGWGYPHAAESGAARPRPNKSIHRTITRARAVRKERRA